MAIVSKPNKEPPSSVGSDVVPGREWPGIVPMDAAPLGLRMCELACEAINMPRRWR
jgi:hypothetical protein